MKKFIVNEEDIRKNEDGTYTVTKCKPYIPSEYLAIGPMDGRYKKEGEKLSPYFSEFALVKNRVMVEVEWLRYLVDRSPFFEERNTILETAFEKIGCDNINLMQIFTDFDAEDFMEVKAIEAETNHDVKSVEIWVARQLDKYNLPELKSFVHFGCTSEDITNCAYALMVKEALKKVWIPAADHLLEMLWQMSEKYKTLPMLAHTHGQPATPTTVGKEFAVYAYRLEMALEKVYGVKMTAKWNGATGNYAAANIAFPEEDMSGYAEEFIGEFLDLRFNPVTTQIESHDSLVEVAAAIAHFNRIVSNFCSDMWTYISMEVFKQIPVKKEVGSSTMPHKVNPINFENGEMNLRKSTADFEFLAEWLMSSRMQRDLRDSTALRNLGTAFAHSYLGLERTMKGLKKVEINKKTLEKQLDGRWEVLAEAVQTVLRKYGNADAYNILKEKTRGKGITKEALHDFIKDLNIPEKDRERLLKLKPSDYVGLAEDIVNLVVPREF